MVEFLVTGGAGFIGSNIVEHLVRGGRPVRVFDNFSSGRRENLAGVADQVEVVAGDLRDVEAVRRAATGVRHVLHLGAMPSVPGSVEEPAVTHDVNVTGTLNVLLAARDAGVKRVVFSSSSSIYGDTAELPTTEACPPAPLSPYAVHKLAGELYCRIFWKLYGLETVSLRYFNVFGPRQDPRSQYAAVIPRFITAVLKNEPPTIFGDGGQTRDFCHVDNIIAANLAACEAPVSALGESFNIAGGRRTSLLELVEVVNGVCGRTIAPRHEPSRAGDIRDSGADIGRAADALNWTPQISFPAGIEKAVAWYRDRLEADQRR